MAAPWVLEGRTREALGWALDVLDSTHPAPASSEHLAHLRTMSQEIGFAENQTAGYGAALAVAALCDTVEALAARVEELERNT
jgi:hypothetical protein